MKPILKYTLVGLLVAVVAGISVAGIAHAEGDFPKGREALTELLGLTEDELKEQLQSGKTVEDLADEAGVDLDAFQEEMHEKRLESMQSRIKEALAAGEISQEHADWLQEGLEKGFLDGPLFGFGGRGKPDGSGEFGPRSGFGREGRPGSRGTMQKSDQ